MHINAEYLIIIDQKSAEALYQLCDTVPEFNKLLQKNPDITIEGSTIQCQKKRSFDYSVTTNSIANKQQRFFHLRVSHPRDIDVYDEFTNLIEGCA